MIKKLYTLLILMFFTITTGFSQTNLTEAVDFTITDTEGNTHTLFQYLDEGKIVLLDFFTTG